MNTTNKVYESRMRLLLAHMRQPKLSVDKFNFGHFHLENTPCGTQGCMAGELPYLFPEYWQLQKIRGEEKMLPFLINPTTSENQTGRNQVYHHLMEFFGLSIDETFDLFYTSQMRNGNASQEEVANSLAAFIQTKYA